MHKPGLYSSKVSPLIPTISLFLRFKFYHIKNKDQFHKDIMLINTNRQNQELPLLFLDLWSDSIILEQSILTAHGWTWENLSHLPWPLPFLLHPLLHIPTHPFFILHTDGELLYLRGLLLSSIENTKINKTWCLFLKSTWSSHRSQACKPTTTHILINAIKSTERTLPEDPRIFWG